MDIKVLGSGCANCKNLEARTLDALHTLGLDAAVGKVTDYGEIASYGVMSTPAGPAKPRGRRNREAGNRRLGPRRSFEPPAPGPVRRERPGQAEARGRGRPAP